MNSNRSRKKGKKRRKSYRSKRKRIAELEKNLEQRRQNWARIQWIMPRPPGLHELPEEEREAVIQQAFKDGKERHRNIRTRRGRKYDINTALVYFPQVGANSAVMDLFRNIFRVDPELVSHPYARDSLQGLFSVWDSEHMIMVRPLSSWKKKGKGISSRLSSLLRHCFEQYAVPGWLRNVFEIQHLATRRNMVRFYVAAGRGGSIREPYLLGTPMTRKALKLFMQSSHSERPLENLRLAQGLAAGVEKGVALEFRSIYLQDRYMEDFFVRQVMPWFARIGMINLAEVSPIIDYLFHMRRGNGDYRMSGRTANSVLRGMHEWHVRTAREDAARGAPKRFSPCGLDDFTFEKRSRRSVTHYTIKEILTLKDLFNEGAKMSHCVASYAALIAEGKCSIWSMRADGERKLTIEVKTNPWNGKPTIVQARGTRNRIPTPTEELILLRWAQESGISLSRT